MNVNADVITLRDNQIKTTFTRSFDDGALFFYIRQAGQEDS